MTGSPVSGTSVIGNVSGTGIAIGAGARASVRQSAAAPDVTTAVDALRTQLRQLDTSDDDVADQVALAENRLARLEEEVSVDGEPDRGRLEKLLSGVAGALGGVTAVAGGVSALQSALSPFLP